VRSWASGASIQREGSLKVFDNLKAQPRLPSCVTTAAMMSGSGAGRAHIAAAGFTAGGTETLSVSREAGCVRKRIERLSRFLSSL